MELQKSNDALAWAMTEELMTDLSPRIACTLELSEPHVFAGFPFIFILIIDRCFEGSPFLNHSMVFSFWEFVAEFRGRIACFTEAE